MMYIVSSNDGTTELDEVYQTALSRVLLEMTGRTYALVVTEVELGPEEVTRNMEDGSINFMVSDFESRTMTVYLTEDQVKAVKQLANLANSAMMMRDILLQGLFRETLKDDGESNELDFERDRDIPDELPAFLATDKEAPPTTKH